MPTYEYIADKPGECSFCANSFDMVQSMKDDALKTCPICGGEIHRLLSAPGGHLSKCWPMKSWANAVNPTQRVDAMKAATEAGIPTYFDERGRPEFTSQSHRRNFLRAKGRYDLDAGYGDPTPGDTAKG